MVPGIYKAEWATQFGSGGGVLVFLHNVIAGADQLGVIFDGEYAFDGQGKLLSYAG